MSIVEIVFWISVFIVFYTYLGYGLLLFCLVSIKERFSPTKKINSDISVPDITLCICAYNEEKVIAEKMNNIFSLNYPKEKIKILWITDGSNDHTNEILSTYSNVQVEYQSAREGKAAALNRGVRFVKTPIVVFTDANAMLGENSLVEVARLFADPTVGCVAGEKRIRSSNMESANATEGVYWRYESKLKELDFRLYSTVGAAGELFAMRTELYTELSRDTLLDDFILSLRIAMKGFRIGYSKDAYAIETSSVSMKEEAKRKKRIAAGGIQSIIRLWPLLNVFKYGILSWQYISHRVLRWTITPILLLLLVPLNLFLLDVNFSLYFIILLFQLIFYFLAFCGWIMNKRKLKNKVFFVPYYFCFMNMNVFQGIAYLSHNKGTGIWEKANRV